MKIIVAIRSMLSLVCPIALLAGIISSCQPENPADPATQLEKVWHFRGFRTGPSGSLKPLPAWSDTVPYFEITITFRRSGYLNPYEMEGQGPLRLYYGSFRASHPDKLTIASLKTTPSSNSYAEALRFDSLYFALLLNVKRFASEEGALILYSDTAELVFEATDRPVYPVDFFMEASVDGLPWKADLNNTLASVIPDTGSMPFHCLIESHTFDSLPNGTRYEMDLLLNRIPFKGIYTLNNSGSEIPTPGAGANCHGWTKDLLFNFFMAWSNQGILAITEVTRFTISGTFQFHAITSGTNPYVKEVTVTQGSFFLPLLKKDTDWFTTFNP